MIWLWLVLLLEAGLLLAAVRYGDAGLRWVLALNMLCINIFPFKLITVCGLTSNLGTLWYTTVVAAQFCIFRRGGRQASHCAVIWVYATLLTICVLIQLSAVIPPTDGYDSLGLRLAADRTMRVTPASLLAFGAAQFVIVACAERLAGRQVCLQYCVAMLAGQAVDSLIFFTIAFEGWQIQSQIFWHGFALKVIFGVCFAPVIWLLSQQVQSKISAQLSAQTAR